MVIDARHEAVGRGHAERLLPMIATLKDGGRCDAVLVDVGPGSFTGIRVGVAAARALGFGWGASVLGYCSLALIAAIDGGQADTAIAIEGGHGEVFVARYASGLASILEAPHGLRFGDAIVGVRQTRVVGSAAGRLVAERGFGSALALAADARAVAHLPAALAAMPPTPFYGRGADARPMA